MYNAVQVKQAYDELRSTHFFDGDAESEFLHLLHLNVRKDTALHYAELKALSERSSHS